MAKSDTEVLKYRDESYDFRDVDTSWGVHGIHPYPAMMVYPIARRLINEYSKEGGVVLDPFMGSGTVLVESILHSRSCIGVDLNPLVLLIANAKTTYIPPKKLYDSIVKILSKKENFEYSAPDFFNINFWFKEYVIDNLARLKAKISAIKDEDIKRFFLVAFSETVRICSNTRTGEFKLLRIKEPEKHNPNVFSTFERIASRNIKKLLETYNNQPHTSAKAIEADSRYDIPDLQPSAIDLVLTSPPYGDSKTTVAYGQFSRLSLQWLGNEEVTVDKDSLGGSPTESLDTDLPSETVRVIIGKIKELDDKRARQVLSFYIDLFACFENINRYLKRGGYICLVVGNRRVKRITIPSDSIVVELLNALGYVHTKTILREIPSKRMPWANSPTNIIGAKETTMNEENIIIMQKES